MHEQINQYDRNDLRPTISGEKVMSKIVER